MIQVIAQRRSVEGVESAAISGLSWTEIDNKIGEFGATRYVSQGEIFIKLEGEWVYIGQECSLKKKRKVRP